VQRVGEAAVERAGPEPFPVQKDHAKILEVGAKRPARRRVREEQGEHDKKAATNDGHARSRLLWRRISVWAHFMDAGFCTELRRPRREQRFV
jgi:hypothetical protein